MNTIFVSRHEGAVRWINSQPIRVDRFESHLDLTSVDAGDTVIGTLPVQLAAKVCEKGAIYLHIVLDLSENQRGVELTSQDISHAGAHLRAFIVKAEDE